jgi:hypothetical protein
MGIKSGYVFIQNYKYRALFLTISLMSDVRYLGDDAEARDTLRRRRQRTLEN